MLSAFAAYLMALFGFLFPEAVHREKTDIYFVCWSTNPGGRYPI